MMWALMVIDGRRLYTERWRLHLTTYDESKLR
jgi:hypothetical protein